MKLSLEERIMLARRKLQGQLISENCTLNINPKTSQNNTSIFPVASILTYSNDDFSRIHSKVLEIIEEFNLVGHIKRRDTRGDNEGFTISLHARKPEELEKITIRDLIDELKTMFTKKQFNN